MDKILICLAVPSVNRTFDLFVPLDLEISELTKVIVNGVKDLCGGGYISSNEEMLNLKNPQMLLNPNNTLRQYRIKDGCEIFLI